jgi:EAL and modified HD-GYP domain-containing signal transduction protein
MAKAFVARQQIQNINGKIEGYELLFRGPDGYVEIITSNLLATSKVLLNTLTHMDFKEIIGEGNKAFINIDHDVLFSGIISLLNPKYFVIELLETTEVSEELIQRLRKLKKDGFSIALDDFDCKIETFKKYAPIMPFLDYIKFDLKNMESENASKFLAHFHKDGKKTLAEKIESYDEFKEAMNSGYKLFQGYHFHRPEIIEMEVPTETAKTTILHIISLLKDNKDTNEIERYARTQPDLVYNLLKYLNSPSIGLTEKITSLKHAMNLLGRVKLMRWLLMYLYAESAGDPIAKSLLETAMHRATTMEKLSSKEDKDRAFLTGMFSLLDVLFNAPMDVILRGVPLENSITSAIKSRSGELGAMLAKVEEEEKKRLKELLDANYEKLNSSDLLILLRKNNIVVKDFE